MNIWTPEMDTQLRHLVLVEKRKLADVAKIMKLKHMAVVGRCWRTNIKSQHKSGGNRRGTGLPKPKEKIVRTFNPGPRQDKRTSKKSAPHGSLINPEFFDLKDTAKRLLDLGTDECRFPITDSDGSLWFCAHATLEDKSYCDHHHKLCYEGKRRFLDKTIDGLQELAEAG